MAMARICLRGPGWPPSRKVADRLHGLFSDEPTAACHRGYGNLRSSQVRPDIREWCEEIYQRHRWQLDEDFPKRFRRDTPKRLSELHFADAFASAGWEPISRVTGFDLAYRFGDRRLLVEVTTPDPPPSDSWGEERHNGHTIYTGDARTTEASLLCLTRGFQAKADSIRDRMRGNPALSSDYKVIGLSGFQIGQETPFTPSSSGPVPDFIRAFLPIGDQYVRFPIGPDACERDAEWGYHCSAEIKKPSGASVARTALLDDLFGHVDAVAYSPINLLGLKNSHWQVGVLHNPNGKSGPDRVDLGMGNEYYVTLHKETFEVQRRKSPDLLED